MIRITDVWKWRCKMVAVALLCSQLVVAATGKWNSSATGSQLTYTTNAATGKAATDINGKPMTVVYLENLAVEKIGRNSNADDVAWLRSNGYQVIELDYAKSEKAVSPLLNKDIMSINSSLQNGSFCGCSCSPYRSYVLMEGYRINRDIPYYLDDPTIYNYPDVYKDSKGDSLYLDLVYPANPSVEVPVLVTFSYSNSFATNSSGKLTPANKHKRMYLPYYWGAFKDSFVEGASAVGFAWAVCDHPKYCDWGQGKYTGGANKSLGAIEVNPDAARKVKSAIRTVRGIGRSLGLSSYVAVTGFSRGSTAAALAVGDADIEAYEDATRGRFAEESSKVTCAILGPGMFDYEHALAGSTEYTRMSAFVKAMKETTWQQQGALATIATDKSAATMFFHNTDDYYADQNKNAQGLYATQARLMKEKLDAVGVANETLTGYSSGHAVPQTESDLRRMYDFLMKHTSPATAAAIQCLPEVPAKTNAFPCDLTGRRVGHCYKGVVVKDGKLYVKR